MFNTSLPAVIYAEGVSITITSLSRKRAPATAAPSRRPQRAAYDAVIADVHGDFDL